VLHQLILLMLSTPSCSNYLNLFPQASISEFSNASYQLSRGALQLRANQLARELHVSEETTKSFRILEERRNEHTAAGLPVGWKAGHQTGRRSLDTARSDDRLAINNEEVEVLSPATARQGLPTVVHSDVEILDGPPQTEKRKKKDGMNETEDASSGKRRRSA
jgi:orotate phosphoribosyltransferase-like protein